MNGNITIDTSKNALLPIIASTILTEGVTTLRRVPRITDIDNLLRILIGQGITAQWNDGDLTIDTTKINYAPVNAEVAAKIRGSIFVMGAILGRFGRANIPFPGGCAIGNRPIDLHIQALRDMGVTIKTNAEALECASPKNRKSTEIFLDFPSVGATENAIMAAVIGRARVKITGAAREPEVEDLCNFLNACGAMICGQGTSIIIIQGVRALHGVTYTAIPDRINTGSYMLAVATVGGNVTLHNVVPSHNANLISKLRRAGADITVDKDTITVRASGRLRGFGTVHTAPYPGFSTDLQSQLAVAATVAKGDTVITENLFENRFKYVPNLEKLGAKICEKEKSIHITGVPKLVAGSETSPAVLAATDLRAGVALVIAGMAAEGRSVVHNAELVYRGHAQIEGDLARIGANIY